jgi:DNA polymerase-4
MTAIQPLMVHVDVDAFFASVEQLLVPALRGRPVIVGSGVIASCSYEARACGLRAGMALHQARKLCPQAVILAGDCQIYRCFAEHVWDVCRRFTCGLETFLDEAYGDATGILSYGPPPALGRELRDAVRREVGLPVSVGLAANRMMAKLASAAAKPKPGAPHPPPRLKAGPLPEGEEFPQSEIRNPKSEMGLAGSGVFWIPPGEEPAYLAPLPIRKLPGVGPRTQQKFLDMNIATIGQLREIPLPALRSMFGRHGEEFYERCRGRECGSGMGILPMCGMGVSPARDVILAGPSPTGPLRGWPSWARRPCHSRLPRSISRQTTFHQPTCDGREIRGMIFYLMERAMRTARQAGLLAGTVGLSIRYDDWKELAAARTLPAPTQADAEAFATAEKLLGQLHRRRVALRHLGVELTNFAPADTRPTLFEAPADVKQRHLAWAVDEIRDRYGHAAVVTGPSIDLLDRLQQNDYGFVLRTPSLTK